MSFTHHGNTFFTRCWITMRMRKAHAAHCHNANFHSLYIHFFHFTLLLFLISVKMVS